MSFFQYRAALIYILWRVGCLPPNYQHLSAPYSPPFTRLPMGVGVWERRGAETARSGGVWWGNNLKWMEPHHRRCYMPSAPLLWRPVSSPCMHAGVLVGPGRERWGALLPHPYTADGPGCQGRLNPGKCRGPKGGRSRWRSRRPSRPGPQRGARAPPDSAPYLDPSFQNTAPPSQPAQHDEGHQIPCLFWTLNPLWTLYFIISV